MIATLTAAGTTASQALAAVFVYRVVSYILVALIGWIVFLILFRHNQHEDLEMDLEFERREQPGARHTPHSTGEADTA